MPFLLALSKVLNSVLFSLMYSLTFAIGVQSSSSNVQMSICEEYDIKIKL